MRVRPVLSVLLGPLVATLVVAAGAAADVGKATEGGGDVFVIDSSGTAYLSTQVANIDLTAHSVSHGKKITLKTRYTDLVTPAKGEQLALVTDLKLKGGADFTFTAGATSKDKSGTPRLFTNNAQKACRGMSVKFDYDADTVVAKVPRSCLGDPAWLRFSTQASLDGAGLFYDRAGSTTSGYREKDNYSAKLYKG